MKNLIQSNWEALLKILHCVKGSFGKGLMLIMQGAQMIENLLLAILVGINYRAVVHTILEMMWLQTFLLVLGFNCIEPITMFCDNQVAIYIANNSIFYERIKYVKVNCPFVGDAIMLKNLQKTKKKSCRYFYQAAWFKLIYQVA